MYFRNLTLSPAKSFTDKFKDSEYKFARVYMETLEKIIREQIVDIEGFMPSNEEIIKYLIRWEPNNTITWKGIPIVIDEGIVSKDHSLRHQFKVRKKTNE